MSNLRLEIEPLTSESYAPFGNVIAAGTLEAGKPANQRTARRYDQLGPLERTRADAPWNLCVFRCAPRDLSSFKVTLLEKHPYSTQLFVPMNAARYLVIVAETTNGGMSPELRSLRAFLATGRQGISYHPGVWHHPLLALDHETDFACVVSEDGGEGDCEVRPIAEAEQRVVSLR